MNRRQFLKRAAAACAGISAAGLAAVAGPSVTEPVPFKPNPVQVIQMEKIRGMGCSGSRKWVTYYDEFAGPQDQKALEAMRVAAKAHPFKVPLGGWI